MQITIINVSVEDKGKYKMAEVAYKDQEGAVKGKKLMSFGTGADVFKALTQAKTGEVYNVTPQKNDKGFWDWVSVNKGSSTATTTTGGTVATPSPKSTYETPEERANRQALIVRQSSVSSAVEYCKLNSKKSPSVEEVIQISKQFEDYVFGRNSDPVAGVAELEDDVPF